MKITKYTEEYIRRFEKFLLDTPESKMKFLQDKFFRDLPKKQNGIFRTGQGRKRGVKCAICMKSFTSDQAMKTHLESEH